MEIAECLQHIFSATILKSYSSRSKQVSECAQDLKEDWFIFTCKCRKLAIKTWIRRYCESKTA